MARVAEFYQKAFGIGFLREHRRDDGSLRSIWLRLDCLLLMIEHTEEPMRRVAGVGHGPFLLAFSVAESERPEVEARLLRLGAVIESRTKYTSYSRDPEGNRVAISHFRADETG